MEQGPEPKLKLQFQCELNRTRAADLVERIEAAILATASEVAVQHLGGLSKLRRGHEVDGTSKIWVIEDVEEIRSRLKS